MVCSSPCYTLLHDRDERPSRSQTARPDERPPGRSRPQRPPDPRLSEELFGLVRDVLRPDLALHDISLSFELVAAIKFADPGRTAELRRRYLSLILDGMRAEGRDGLPGPPPGWQEISERWYPG